MRSLRYLIILALCLPLFAVVSAPTDAQAATCPGAPAPRLIGATQGRVAQVYSSLRQAVRSNVVLDVMQSKEVFQIRGNPVCAGPHWWYPVTYNGIDGWATEGYLSQYWLEPVPTTPPQPPQPPSNCTNDPVTGVEVCPTTTACPGAPAPRLVPGGTAQVAQVYSSLRAGVHSDNILTIMRTGQTMEVLAGPFCSSGPYNWYQVRFNGVTGWATEGTGSGYWLAPA